MSLTQISTGGIKDATIATVDIADEAVSLAKLPHGTGSNDGKFLRANNGADPTFESIPAGTTINNEGSDRILTSTSTANTIHAESNLSFSTNQLTIAHGDPKIALVDTTNNTDAYIFSDDNGSLRFQADQNSEASDSRVRFQTDGTERVSIDSELKIFNGNLFFGTSGKGVNFHTSNTGTANLLDDYEEGSWTPVVGGWDTFTPYSGATYNYGWYRKVGSLIHIGWKIYIQHLTTPATSGSQHIRITGLPFANQTYAAGPVGHVRFDIPEFGFEGYPLAYLGEGGSILYMYKHIDGGNNLVAINAAASRSNVWTMGTATYSN